MSNNKRPLFLTVLCVLSFIGSGMAAISNIFVFINHDLVQDAIRNADFSALGIDPSFFVNVEKKYFLLSGLLNIISFTGVRHMWLMRKAGFHLYAISQLMMLIISTIYIYRPSEVFPMFDLLIVSIFVLMYLKFRDLMN